MLKQIIHGVEVTRIARPGKLYRVGRRLDSEGLWYDAKGNETGLIHTIKGAAAAALPMGPSDVFKLDNTTWQSVTNSLLNLKNWFSLEDMRQLIEREYELLEIETTGHAHFKFPTYAHEVFSPQQLVAVKTLDVRLLYPELS